MENLKKIFFQAFVLFAAVWAIYKVFGWTLLHDKSTKLQPRCPEVVQTENITEQELEAFLNIWPSYQQRRYDKKDYRQVSFLSGKPSERLPWQIRFWLFKNCWDTDRFYYVEQRLREILQSSYLRRHSADVIAVLNQLIEDETDENRIAAYNELITFQQKIANVENISEAEFELIAGQEDEILEILDNKPAATK